MFKTIIWATDGSQGAEAALPLALEFASLGRGRIIAVHCDYRTNGRSNWPSLPGETDRRHNLAHKVENLVKEGLDIELIVRRSHLDPADVVAAVAEEVRADVIVCGTRGLGGVSGLVHGAFGLRLTHIARCPVVSVPSRPRVSTGVRDAVGTVR